MSFYNSFVIPSASGQSANAVLENLECTPTTAVGDVVRVDAAGIVTPAMANSLTNSLVLGVVESKTDTTTATVRISGVSGEGIFSGLSESAEYYLSATTPGQITQTIPTTAGQVIVKIGQAFGTDRLLVAIGDRILRS